MMDSPLATSAGMDHSESASLLPKVSVCMISYNHAKFIAESIESVLSQKRDGLTLEFIIADDASTDATQDIIREFQERHPEIIKPILRPTNWGVTRNFTDALGRCKGEYVAIIEGDDYWTVGTKLESQLRLLQSDSQTSLVFGNAIVVDEQGHQLGHCRSASEAPHRFGRTELIARTLGVVPTGSAMFRRSLLQNFPAWAMDLPFTDRVLWSLAAAQGTLTYTAEILAAYRVHAQGTYNSLRFESLDLSLTKALRWIEADLILCDHWHSIFPAECEAAIRKSKAYELLNAAWVLRLQRQPRDAFTRIFNALKANPRALWRSRSFYSALFYSLIPVADTRLESHRAAHFERLKKGSTYWSFAPQPAKDELLPNSLQ